ncbi:hypothetical protein PVAG01_10804 [Phlyctema vagabunda]|uniref:Flavin-containing monooxygenase n=1 Tax=Phlyctema vagabunda TaxID=108571 RepID=A0ABR4P3A8_9HELO
MGSVVVENPISSQRVEPGSFPVEAANLPTTTPAASTDAVAVAKQWVESFNKTITQPDLRGVSDVFLAESYWRDQLCLSWDFHTFAGPEKIASQLKQAEKGPRIKSIALDPSSEYRSPHISASFIQAFVAVDTDVGRGSGLVRLAQDEKGWKAFTLFTYLQELKGHEELLGKKRPNGVEHGEHISRKNWLDRRNAEENYEEGDEPTVLILGGGQGGLTAAARLKMLGVKSLIVDREEKIGDNWRTRYHQLVLHDPVWYDHLPYLPFPAHWPIFTPKDKLGDWFEAYAKLLELNFWTQTSVTKTSWDDATKKWTVTLERNKDGMTETRILHPKHVIQATGHSGEPNFPSHLKGLSTFKGQVTHSSKFPGAKPSQGQNKRAIVVGCCNSGHDIAQDFYENGYSVTMIQRSSTYVISAETNLQQMSGLWCDGGPSTDEADTTFHSIPNAVLKRMNIAATEAARKTDERMLQGLAKAGFKTDKGPDESGLWMKYMYRGGGYYLDVGCSQLIVDGKIKVKQGVEISEILENGAKFEDGTFLEADEIVFATGYQNMRTQCRKIFGDEIADRVEDVWGFDKEGELRTMWRKTGHPGFWFMGGNLALCRFYSRFLALQIKALEEGICTYEDK